jgi:hypothetical protein
MPELNPSLHPCPDCGLPFKTEDNLGMHIANWHSTKPAAQKPVDPVALPWRDLVHRVFDTPEGFQGLSEPEKRYFAVCLLEGEVYNGGFDQFFFNHSGTYYEYILLGLQDINAPHSIDLLQSAKIVLFNDKDVPEKTVERREILLQQDSDKKYQLLEELDKKFWQDPDNLAAKINAYAKLHGLL